MAKMYIHRQSSVSLATLYTRLRQIASWYQKAFGYLRKRARDGPKAFR
jgi:hypothetical protein